MARRRRVPITEWCAENKDILWDLLRIYLGFALVVKGFVYILSWRPLVAMMEAQGVPFAGHGLAEIIALAHIAGGLMLAFGLLTRVGALIQIPNLLGAVLFVHLKNGLFTEQQTLEFATLVLGLLVMFAFGGSGRLSIDYYFDQKHEAILRQGAEPHPAT
jgi:uncharacterized membrane protein YphA (DoxX/SURF4 family)